LIPENITREHLLKAIEEINNEGIRKGRQSSTYDLVFRDKKYPPKLVLSIANKHANGIELDYNSFWGGKDTPAFKMLEKHGFEIMKKEAMKSLGIEIQPNVWIEKTIVKGRQDREEGKRALGSALWSPQVDKRGADIYKNMRRVKEGDIVLHLINNDSFESLSIVKDKAIKTNGVGGTDWEGPAFLIELAQNTKLQPPIPKESILSDRHKQSLLKISESREVFFTKKMTLRQGAYLTPCSPALLDIINEEYNRISSNNIPLVKFPVNSMTLKLNHKSFSIDILYSSLISSNLSFSNQLISRFTASLATKPFVLLSGLSGSGKTKLAEAFVKWICQDKSQYKLVPVGADWTNREPLLGFPNALSPGEYTHPDNGVLKLIMEANANSDRPYFLILDEMNLSHVERYFADFLSTMESSDAEIQLHDNDEIRDVPKTLKLPKNLFIIGTVNIDETTYMFSPKVLDRANTIEFRVAESGITKFFDAPKDIDLKVLESKGANMASSFLELSLKSSEEADTKLVKDELVAFFRELQKLGAEFGYRTANEAVKLTARLGDFGVDDKNTKIDVAIMQKLLPKLSGSRRKLSKVLVALGQLCLVNEKTDIEKEFFTTEEPIDFEDKTKIKYPLSFEKITRMYRNARDNGFASYAEA